MTSQIIATVADILHISKDALPSVEEEIIFSIVLQKGTSLNYKSRLPYFISVYNKAATSSLKASGHEAVAKICMTSAVQAAIEFLQAEASATSNKSSLTECLDMVDINFLTELINALSKESVQSIFRPVLLSLVKDMQHACDNITLLDNSTMFQILEKFSKITKHPKVINLIASLLDNESAVSSKGTARELQNASILAAFFEPSPTPPHGPKYYSRLVSYPHSPEFDGFQKTIQESLKQYQERLHALIKSYLTCKENDQIIRNDILNWFGTMMEMNDERTRLNIRDPAYTQILSMLATEGCMLNIYKVLLLFAEPFLDTNSGRHKLIHPRYCQFSRRVEYQHQPKLTMSNIFTLDGVDEKMESGNFSFVSDIFFLTLHALHVIVAPACKVYKECTPAITRTQDFIQRQRNELGDAWLTTPEGQRQQNLLTSLYYTLDSYDAHLFDPHTLELTMKFISLTMFWLLEIYKQYKSQPTMLEQFFASYPEYIFKAPLDVINYISIYKPKYLLKMNLLVVMEFAQTFLNQPTLVRSPIVRAKLSLVLTELHLHTKPIILPPKSQSSNFGFSFNQKPPSNPNQLDDADRLLFSRLFTSQLTQESLKQLVGGLLTTYKDVDVVEGLDVDKENFDKYSIRNYISTMLNDMWSNEGYKRAIIDQLCTNDSQRINFLGTVLNDAIMLLDDSLGRLIDIKQIQLAMENVVEWESQPPHKKQERLKYYEVQERSAKGFLTLALSTLDLLLNLAKELFQYFVSASEIRFRLVAMLLHFFEILCGPKCNDLKVKNPEKYMFQPKELLKKIVTLTLCFAPSDEFKKAMAADITYNHDVMQMAQYFIVHRQILPQAECTQFSEFIQAIEQLRTAGKRDSDISNQDMVVEMDEAALKELEQEYISELQPLVFDEADMKEGEKYRHHFHANIMEGVNIHNKERMQRLATECQILANDLPSSVCLSSGIFVRTDCERADVMKALIIGPQGTPYAGGCFIFDIYLPATYPHDPPLVNLETTGNGTVRFNPNLYNCGKVCLSLLGTWHGDKSSKWNPSTSNLKQVLMSIQALILVEEPYYNEPSYEMQRGTTEGAIRSHEYNQLIRYNTIRFAIIEALRYPAPEFEDVIKKHLKIQKHIILQQARRWLSETNETEKPKFQRLLDELTKELSKL